MTREALRSSKDLLKEFINGKIKSLERRVKSDADVLEGKSADMTRLHDEIMALQHECMEMLLIRDELRILVGEETK